MSANVSAFNRAHTSDDFKPVQRGSEVKTDSSYAFDDSEDPGSRGSNETTIRRHLHDAETDEIKRHLTFNDDIK